MEPEKGEMEESTRLGFMDRAVVSQAHRRAVQVKGREVWGVMVMFYG